MAQSKTLEELLEMGGKPVKRGLTFEELMKRGAKPVLPPEKEKPFIRKAGEAVGEVATGIVKGGLRTLITPAERIAKVAEVGIKARGEVETQQSLERLGQTNLELFKRAREETDPEKKQKLLSEAEANFRQLQKLSGIEAERPKTAEVVERVEEALEPKGLPEKIGFGAEKLAEFFIPSGAIRKAELAITKGVAGLPKIAGKPLEIAGRSIAEGVSGGLVISAQGEELGDVGKTALLISLFSAPLKAFGVVRGGVEKALREGAVKKATEALAPTIKTMKQKAERIVSELLKRRVKFLTLGGLQSKAQKGIEAAGEVLDEAYSRLPENTRIAISPIIENIEKLKSGLIIKGTNTVPEAAMSKWASYQGIQDELIKLAQGGENTISIGSLRSYRQILDKLIKEKGKVFGLTGNETAKLASEKAMANSIRNEIAKEFPDIAKINSEFNFWSNVKEITKATIERKKPQSGLINQLAGLTGFGAGFISGGVGRAVGLGVILNVLTKALRSPFWKNTSALTKNRIADLISKGDDKVIGTLNKIIAGTISKITPKKKE